MRHLPLECITRVIELVDNHHDLFNLLTVSKDVFLIAARCLYHDPIKTSSGDYESSITKMVLFLLSLSPADSTTIDTIRRSNGLSPSGAPLDPKPTIDYLSLVKVIRWRYRSDYYSPLCSALKHSNEDLYKELTWAFVGHRLNEIEELEIDVDDQERYLKNVAKMTRLRKLWIYCHGDYEKMYDFAETMIKAIQMHHGPDQVRECCMLPCPIDWYNHFHDPLSSQEIDTSIRSAQKVISLLPPPRYYPTLLTPDGSTVTLDHPFDPYVVVINKVWSIDYDAHPSWKVLTRMYPGFSKAQILQRLRGLNALHIHPETANGDDENLLAWAACEAEYYHRHSGEHQFGPLVPLEILDISSLVLHGLTIDQSSWEQVPNITNMEIQLYSPLLRDGSPISNRAQDTQNLEATVNPPSSSLADTTATVTTEQRLQRESLEVRFHCPKLTTLTLWNQAVNLLDPTCFHFSPNIQHLELRNWNLMDLAFVNYGEDDSIKEPDVLKVLHPTRWTWDWHFPFLNRFRLEGDLHQLRFTLAFLYTCPSLERMELYHEATGIRFPLRVKGILDNPLDKTNNNNQTSPFTHNKLAKLTLGGNLEVGVDELASLLQALPSLKEIELGSIDFGNINFEDRELVEISRTHPALERVTTNIKCTTKPPSAIGLARIGDKRPNVGPNIGGDNGKDDSEMPEK